MSKNGLTRIEFWEQEQFDLWEGEPEQADWLRYMQLDLWEGLEDLNYFFEPDRELDLDGHPEMDTVRSLVPKPVKHFTCRIILFRSDPPDSAFPALRSKLLPSHSIWKFYNEADELIFRIRLDTLYS